MKTRVGWCECGSRAVRLDQREWVHVSDGTPATPDAFSAFSAALKDFVDALQLEVERLRVPRCRR